MITAGIIREIGINKGNFIGNAYKVELNIFQIPGDGNKSNYTYVANCSTIPGLYDSYAIGDVVYVGFLNNDKSLPIILGKIYQGLDNKSNGKLKLKGLSVTGHTELSKNTFIGNISFSDIQSTVQQNAMLQEKVTYLENKINEVITIDSSPTSGSTNPVTSGGVFDALSGKLDASKSAVATVGGLVTPSVTLANNELVGVGTNGEQISVQLGENLILEGSTSPYTLKASGGGGGGGFTPRFIYNLETVSASRFDVTKSDYYFNCKVKSDEGDLVSVSFTANVNCYVIIHNDVGASVSIGKAMNAGETLSKNLGYTTPQYLTVRVYPTAEYDSTHLTIGVLTIVEV